jgi:hypothetical protein
VARDSRKFFRNIMHGRAESEEMIRRDYAIQEMIGGRIRKPDASVDGSSDWKQLENTRERRRERNALRANFFPPLPGWADLCRAYGPGIGVGAMGALRIRIWNGEIKAPA